MSESSEDWKAFKERGKQHRKNKEFEAVYNLAEYCKTNRVTLDFIQDWHIRMTNGITVLDIFPQKNRYHVVKGLNKGKRGRYKELISFVKSIFE